MLSFVSFRNLGWNRSGPRLLLGFSAAKDFSTSFSVTAMLSVWYLNGLFSKGGSGPSGSTSKTVEKYSFNVFAVSWSVEVRLPLGITSFETTNFVLVLDLT